MAAKKQAIEEIIEKSGNSFHARVVNVLRQQKWEVLVSPYYSDNFTDKPREIDIIAEKPFDVNDFISDWLGTLNVRFFIECKYITGDTVFWFDNKDRVRSIERMMKDTGMEHPDRSIVIEGLHYFPDTPVAKLFSSAKGNGGDSDPMNKAVNQNLNALIYYRNRGDLIPRNPHIRNNILIRLSYPIIVVNSFENFFHTDMADPGGKVEQITEPFQLEVNYAYMDKERTGCNEYFLIDIVSINQLPTFLSMFEAADIKVMSEKLRWDKRQK